MIISCPDNHRIGEYNDAKQLIEWIMVNLISE